MCSLTGFRSGLTKIPSGRQRCGSPGSDLRMIRWRSKNGEQLRVGIGFMPNVKPTFRRTTSDSSNRSYLSQQQICRLSAEFSAVVDGFQANLGRREWFEQAIFLGSATGRGGFARCSRMGSKTSGPPGNRRQKWDLTHQLASCLIGGIQVHHNFCGSRTRSRCACGR